MVYFYLFFIIFLNWKVIASQRCVGFCCTATWSSQEYSSLRLHPTPSPSHPSGLSQGTGLSSLCYTATSRSCLFCMWQYMCFSEEPAFISRQCAIYSVYLFVALDIKSEWMMRLKRKRSTRHSVEQESRDDLVWPTLCPISTLAVDLAAIQQLPRLAFCTPFLFLLLFDCKFILTEDLLVTSCWHFKLLH